jgi:predicted DCC family thiol-disulfide oxidoreductase YuxK
MRSLTVLYDARCGLCSNARRWLVQQRQLVPLELVPASSDEARRRFPTLAEAEPSELVVVSEEGDVYRGPSAWIVCLWALQDFRDWSFRLAAPALLPLARGAFEWISTRRHALSRALRMMSDEEIAREATRADGRAPAACAAVGGGGAR